MVIWFCPSISMSYWVFQSDLGLCPSFLQVGKKQAFFFFFFPFTESPRLYKCRYDTSQHYCYLLSWHPVKKESGWSLAQRGVQGHGSHPCRQSGHSRKVGRGTAVHSEEDGSFCIWSVEGQLYHPLGPARDNSRTVDRVRSVTVLEQWSSAPPLTG